MEDKLSQLKRLLELYPADKILLLSLGKEYIKEEQFLEAIRVLEGLIAVDSQYSVGYRYLGEAYVRAGNKKEAIRVFQKGIEIAQGKGDIQTAKEMSVFLKRSLS